MAGGDRVGLTVDDLVALGYGRECCVHEHLIASGERAADAIGEAVAYWPPDLHICEGPLTTFLLLRGIEDKFPWGALKTSDAGWVGKHALLEPEYREALEGAARAGNYRSLQQLKADPRAWAIGCRKHAAMVEGRRPVPASLDEWGPDCVRCGADEFRIDGYCSIYCRDLDEVEREAGRAEPTLVLPVESWPRVRCPESMLNADGGPYNFPVCSRCGGTRLICPALEYATELGLADELGLAT